MTEGYKTDRLQLGVCYYPEAWPKEYWEKDLKTMLSKGIDCVRVAEFTWTLFEPEEGKFDFSLFDDFLSLCKTVGMRVIFCTPTAIPPIWMSEKYPEILNADKDGNKYYHGFRRHCNYSSEKYFELSAIIVEQVAKHYGQDRTIIGWQIDNEFNCENNEYHSESDHLAFREYVKEKYGTLDELNKAWGAVFWNQYYTDWAQVFLPRKTVVGVSNPHLMLEEKEFYSYRIRKYCKLQSDILRKNIYPGCFVTHNGVFDNLDSHKLTEESLDFMTYDSYPNFAFIGSAGIEASVLGEDAVTGDSGLFDRKWSRNLSTIRSISPHFMITEQQCGPGGSYGRISQATPKKGQNRLWTFQSIAHGADLVSYFRWRTTPVGSEMYWHGFYNYNMTPTPRLEEVLGIYQDIRKADAIAGSEYVAKVAFVHNYLSDWDGSMDNWSGPVGKYSETNWITALEYTHTPFDFLYLYDDTELEKLIKYDVLIINRVAIITESMANLLHRFVAQGGTLIVGPRNSYKDEHGHCLTLDMPGHLGKTLGVMVEDFTLVSEFDEPQMIKYNDSVYDAHVYYDILKCTGESTEILGRYTNGDFEGKPAVTVNHVGKGKAYYFGAGVSALTAQKLIEEIGFGEIAEDLFGLPKDIEICVRRKNDAYYYILLNYKAYPITYDIKKPMHELLTDDTLNGTVSIPKYGVQIFEQIQN